MRICRRSITVQSASVIADAVRLCAEIGTDGTRPGREYYKLVNHRRSRRRHGTNRMQNNAHATGGAGERRVTSSDLRTGSTWF